MSWVALQIYSAHPHFSQSYSSSQTSKLLNPSVQTNTSRLQSRAWVYRKQITTWDYYCTAIRQEWAAPKAVMVRIKASFPPALFRQGTSNSSISLIFFRNRWRCAVNAWVFHTGTNKTQSACVHSHFWRIRGKTERRDKKLTILTNRDKNTWIRLPRHIPVECALILEANKSILQCPNSVMSWNSTV